MRFSCTRILIFVLFFAASVMFLLSLNSANKLNFHVSEPILIDGVQDGKRDQSKILCIVMTTDANFLSRSVVSYNAWSHKCDKTLYACNCENITRTLNSNRSSEEIKSARKVPIWQINMVENYDLMAKKAMFILETAFEKYSDEFKFTILVDDDTFVFVDNLRSFIRTKKHTEPCTYGYNFKTIVQGGYHSGGGGVLFTHESLKRIYKNIKNGACSFEEGHGDIAIGECANLSGVKMGDSLDSVGRERFHTIDIGSHFTGEFPDWLFEYSLNTPKKGVECCSEESITFHYVSSMEMKIFAMSNKLSDTYKRLNFTTS